METNIERQKLLVGTTGDYNPMSFYDSKTETYKGFDIELAEKIADALGVKIKFIKTTWPALLTQTQSGDFDFAIGGISVTEERLQLASMTDGYISSGKTILCRKCDVKRYQSIKDINRPEIKIAVNPGGTNQLFVNQFCPKSQHIIHEVNQEIPSLIAENKADIMITDTVEAAFYAKENPELAAPLLNQPFTNSQFGILLKRENQTLLTFLNAFIKSAQKNGLLDELKKKYLGI